MKRLRVYITDTHVLVRQMMVNILRTMQDVTVQGTTSGSDEEGIFHTLQHDPPDLLLMGIHEYDSLEMDLFHYIRTRWPNLSIIVITPKTPEGGKIALEALRHGAVEFITTPERKVNIPNARVHFLKRVVPAIRMVSRINTDRYRNDVEISSESLPPASPERFRLAIIGGNTGGVHSLIRFVTSLPGSLACPIVVVQQLPSPYCNVLAGMLAESSEASIRLLQNGERLLQNQIYLVPGGFHATVHKIGGFIEGELHRGPRENRCRPSLDVLLRSAARSFGHQVMAILLSGGGTDGLDGVRNIRQAGGSLLVESRESALLWDLPGRAVRNGLAEGSLSATRLASELFRAPALLSGRDIATGT